MTTADPQESDAELIRLLVHEQQQFVQEFAARGGWTADDAVEFHAYLFDRTESSVRRAVESTCSNWRELWREFWRTVPTSDEPAHFESWSVDVATLQRDPEWTWKVNELEARPAGRTYIATVTIQPLSGDSYVRDLHFNVQNGEAFWFVNPWVGEGCLAGA